MLGGPKARRRRRGPARAGDGRASEGADVDGDTRRRAMAFLLASNIFAFKGAVQAEVRRALVVARTDGGDVDVAGVASRWETDDADACARAR